MQVVLLAAGLGSRLGALTKDIPKALISVAGKPLLFHALEFAARLKPAKMLVVGGFGFPLVKQALDQGRATNPALAGLSIELLENTNFRDGNLISLLTARPHVSEGFLLLNVDHIYRAPIAEVVAPEAAEVTAFIDTDRLLGADDMKVERAANGRVRRIAKTLTTFDSGYVGMTRVPTAALSRYWQTADAAVAEEGRAIHVERILARLAEGDAAPLCRDISGPGWLEVDTAEERAAAEKALLASAS
ncbi:MAG TPA: NTP transferase domain-containing protein [Polyangia bacterium]